jgi:hypothetical protein
LLDVEIEGSDAGEHAQDVFAWPDGSVARDDDCHSVSPGGDDRRRKVEGVDARVMLLDVGPEAPGEYAGGVAQRRVVVGGAPLVEIADQDLPNRGALDPEVIDQLTRWPLAAQCRVPQRRARLGDAQNSEHLPRVVHSEGTRATAAEPPGQQGEKVVGFQLVQVSACLQHESAENGHRLEEVLPGDAAVECCLLDAVE